jgi:hypothetical protein
VVSKQCMCVHVALQFFWRCERGSYPSHLAYARIVRVHLQLNVSEQPKLPPNTRGSVARSASIVTCMVPELRLSLRTEGSLLSGRCVPLCLCTHLTLYVCVYAHLEFPLSVHEHFR